MELLKFTDTVGVRAAIALDAIEGVSIEKPGDLAKPRVVICTRGGAETSYDPLESTGREVRDVLTLGEKLAHRVNEREAIAAYLRARAIALRSSPDAATGIENSADAAAMALNTAAAEIATGGYRGGR